MLCLPLGGVLCFFFIMNSITTFYCEIKFTYIDNLKKKKIKHILKFYNIPKQIIKIFYTFELSN